MTLSCSGEEVEIAKSVSSSGLCTAHYFRFTAFWEKGLSKELIGTAVIMHW